MNEQIQVERIKWIRFGLRGKRKHENILKKNQGKQLSNILCIYGCMSHGQKKKKLLKTLA